MEEGVGGRMGASNRMMEVCRMRGRQQQFHRKPRLEAQAAIINLVGKYY